MRPAVLLPAAFILAALTAYPARAQDPAGLAHPETAGAQVRQPDPGSGGLITLELREATLEQALVALGRAARLEVSYTDAVTRNTRKVTVALRRVWVDQAIDELLRGTGLEAIRSEDGRTLLVRERRAAAADSAAIYGVVTDARTGQALAGAEVFLEGTRWRTATTEAGRYRLSDLGPGEYRLVVRRIGFTKQSRVVTVAEGEEATVDVALETVATHLDEIVTTVTGDQRLRELGHVVGRINADSLVREVPVSNITELLTSRVPGLLVQTQQGTVGGDVKLQVRSPTSTWLSTEPIVIVDGIRYTSTPRSGPLQTYDAGPFASEPTSRLNDLNPNDIETIEVVKGPSAATLYGTDAANGVIVITTKRGRPGVTQWNAYGRVAASSIPTIRLPDNHYAWGRRIPGDRATNCTLLNLAAGGCAQDSLAVYPNPLNDPELSIFGEQPRWEYGANVSGGGQDVRYYFSGDFERAIGGTRMPPAIADQLKQQRGVSELPEEQLDPNAFTKANLRTNLTASLGKTAQLRVNAGYTQNATRTLNIGTPYPVAFGDPTTPYRVDNSPVEAFAATSTERVHRFSGSASGEWRPTAWFLGRATAGVDLASSTRYSLARAGETLLNGDGVVGEGRTRYFVSTFELGGTASFGLGRLSSRTSLGAQYQRNLSDALANRGRGLPPGGSSIGEASSVSVSQDYHETVTLGSYVEQTVGLNNRLFLTGAVRADGASGFGRDYDVALYPKASVSWILSEEPFLPRVPGVDELRLRYAFGASGQQPWPEWAREGYAIRQTLVDGEVGNGVDVTSLGNPDLRPERVREHEFGLDAAALDGRVQLELTWNRRRTVDQLQQIALGPAFGVAWTNLGLITGHGFEAQLTTRLLDTRAVSWDVSIRHAWHTSELVDWGDAPPFNKNLIFGGYVEGYPLGAVFSTPVESYADANGNGIIETTEVQLGDSLYVGPSTPTRIQSLQLSLGFFRRRLRLSGLFDRHSGFVKLNAVKQNQCAIQRCAAALDPGTRLAEQAEVAALELTGQWNFGFLESGDFTRLREVAVSLDLPAGLVNALRLRQATLSLQGRNLALWTDFGGGDPESVAGGLPQSRAWVVRLDVGF